MQIINRKGKFLLSQGFASLIDNLHTCFICNYTHCIVSMIARNYFMGCQLFNPPGRLINAQPTNYMYWKLMQQKQIEYIPINNPPN